MKRAVQILGRLLGWRLGRGRHAHGNPGAPTLVVFADRFVATYAVSFELPLQRLHARGEVNFSAYSHADVQAGGPLGWRRWLRQARPDAVVMTRYGRTDAAEILEFCHRRGIPVVYHIDDDLLQLPQELGAEVLKRHADPQTVAARERVLAGCDLIYASSVPLAEMLRSRFPGQRVYQGLSAPYLETRAGPAGPGLPPTIGYMGSAGHQEDLRLVVPALVRLMNERPQLRFETFGTITMPAEMAAFGNRVRHYPGRTEYTEFLARLGQLDWHIGLAPLADSPFNRCKAPIKYVEYTASGIPTLASDMQVYASAIPAGGGALVADDWHAALARWLDDPAARLQALERARAHCRAAHDLDQLAAQVMHVTTVLARRSGPRRDIGLLADLPALARHLWQPGALLRRAGGMVAGRAWGPVQRAGDPAQARLRVLFVANSFLPTLQLCFTRPLQPLAESGDIAWEVLADIQLRRPGRLLSGGRGRWARARIEAFQPDVVVFCRYNGAHAGLLTEWARAHGVPTVYHLDDDLLEVPRELGPEKHAFHNHPKRLGAVRHLLRHADLVYCSTLPLLERMREHGFAGRGLAARVHCPGRVLREAPQGGVFKIGYMGIDHAHDFQIALPALVRVLERNPQVHFELFGPIAKPPALDRFGERVTQVEFEPSYDKFLRKFATLEWAVGICPLADTPFNRTKANNKWVEYTAVGAAVVASAGMLYDQCCADGCGLLAADEGQWEAALQSLIDDPARRLATVAAAQARLVREYSSVVLREQLQDLFREVRSGRPRPAVAGAAAVQA